MSLDRLKEQIKDAPLSMIVGQFMTLQKRGANHEGICPFHADTKPSLKVNDAKGLYKCFACGAGGDAITFVMEYKKLEFVDAMKELAGILNIPFEEFQKDKKKNPRVEMAFRVLNASVKLYRFVAGKNPPAYAEFIEKRKLAPEMVERFQLGYSPANNALLHYLQTKTGDQKEFALKVAQDLGIIRANDSGRQYDFYRDRVMFPIHDHQGQVRGYQSRAVLPGQQPKYLNSGESFLFEKANILFGFCFAKHSIRDTDSVIIAEGNMDVIMMHQFGFTQTVGTMGTAMSPQTVKILSGMTKNVFLGMDSDAAGKKAMHKINAEFMALGILPKLLSFDPAKDPDEFLLNHGRLALIERMEKAPILLNQLIEEVMPRPVPENTEIKLATLHRIFELVSPLKEHLSATERVVNAARELGLKSDPSTILEDYKAYLSRQKEKTPAVFEKPKLTEETEIQLETEAKARDLQVKSQSQETRPLTKSEQLFVKEILCHPEFLTHLHEDESLAYIDSDEVKRLIHWLIKIYREIDDAEYVAIVTEEVQYGGYSKEIRDLATEALFNHGNRYNDKVVARMLKDYRQRLQMDQLKTQRRILVEKQRTEPKQEEIDLILSEISRLDREILQLKNTP